MAAIGAWKKMITNGQKAATAMLIFVGTPLSQVIYGMILKNGIADANLSPDSYFWQIIIGLDSRCSYGRFSYFSRKSRRESL